MHWSKSWISSILLATLITPSKLRFLALNFSKVRLHHSEWLICPSRIRLASKPHSLTSYPRDSQIASQVVRVDPRLVRVPSKSKTTAFAFQYSTIAIGASPVTVGVFLFFFRMSSPDLTWSNGSRLSCDALKEKWSFSILRAPPASSAC